MKNRTVLDLQKQLDKLQTIINDKQREQENKQTDERAVFVIRGFKPAEKETK